MTHDHHGPGGSHPGHDMADPHAGHDMHSGNSMVAHAGHDMHAGHNMAADPHAGHDMSAHAVSGHGHHGHGGGKVTWKAAAQATLHCLTGCAIGEILGLVIGTAFGWHNGATTVTAIILAFVFGYALTMFGVRNSGLGFGQIVKVALAADTVSIIVMEIIDNGMMWVIPGAMEAGLDTGLFWGSLAVSLVLAFLVTTPVNKWIIGKGKGHAVVHQYHSGH